MSIRPLTMTATIERSLNGRQTAETQVVTRTRDRMHVQLAGGREWLFEQNPVDRRRVSGTLVDHATKTIVVHEESDLHRRLGVRGWSDAVTFGIDADVMATLSIAAGARTVGGIRFTRYVGSGPSGALRDLWWNREHALPGAFTMQQGSTSVRLTVSRIGPVTKHDVLTTSRLRYRDYRVIDLADWLER